MSRPILVIGHGGHGKDQFAEYLAPYLTAKTSSLFAAEQFLFNELRAKYGYRSVHDCWRDRRTKRAEWFNGIKAYNGHDPARLAKALWGQYDVYVGMRSRVEFEAVQRSVDPLVLWVDRSQHKSPEPPDSMELSVDDADLFIDNNGTLGQLQQQAELFLRMASADYRAELARRERALEHG